MPSSDASDLARRPPIDWPRAAEGLQMAGLAVFLLLNTTGRLAWSFWIDAIALWPVLLMSAGLRVAVEKTRASWLVLLGPALVLGSLAWLATGNATVEVASGPWVEQTRPRPEGVTRLRLRTQLAAARLSASITSLDPATLVEARSIDRTGGTRFDSQQQGDAADLRLEGSSRQGLALAVPGRRQQWDLKLPASLPLSLELRGVAVRSTLDLTRGRLEGGRVEGVFLGTRLDLPATEQAVTLHVRGVFNALHVTVPEGTPVSVHGAGLPFNAVDRGLSGRPGRVGYDIRVDGIFSAVAVDARPGAAPSPEPPRPARPRPEAEPPGR